MTSSQGTEYYLKSMNGIKSFDDGSGTVIEDDSITVANLTSHLLAVKPLRIQEHFILQHLVQIPSIRVILIVH